MCNILLGIYYSEHKIYFVDQEDTHPNIFPTIYQRV